MGETGQPPPEDGEIIARLLRAAGARPDASQETKERVKAVVHARWRQSVRARRRFRLLAWCAASLAAAIVVLTVALGSRRGGVAPPDPREAAGTLILSAGVLRGPDGTTVLQGTDIPPGSILETAPDARAALRLSGGAEVRLDAGTRITLQESSLLELERGAVYVDSGKAAGQSGNLEIRTRIGNVRDVGTQFEVRVHDRELKVRVRLGSVNVHRKGRAEGVSAGTELTVDEAGNPRLETVPPNGPAWDWILGVAPEFELEGRTLGEFLEWVAAETGLRVKFSDASVERESIGIILHGSVAGLRPDQAPEAVLPTCGLSHRVAGDTLVVNRAVAEDVAR